MAKWGEDLSFLFKGFTREEALRAFVWITDNYFMPLIRPDMLKLLEDHKKQGHIVMILSGMFNAFLEVIGQRLSVDFVVGTKLEIRNDVYSGRIIQPLCFGENKARFLNEYVQQNKLDVDFEKSFAYADSIFDAPVFKMVGNPVATYPDKALYEEAIRRKWPVIGEPVSK